MDLNSGVILLPTAAVLLIAIATRSTLPALAGGVVLGHVLLDGPDAIRSLAESLTTELTSPTVAWVVLVCGLLGAITQLLVRAGGTTAFAGLVSARVETGRGGLMAAWAAGLMIFLDDYLNVLLIGGGLRPVTDRLRVPRERLAYVIDATAAPVCLLVPLSTWAIYVAGLLETSGAAAEGRGMATYIGLIPWIFYGWFTVAIVPLVICGWIPAWGGMRSADARVAAGGDVAPPDSPSEPEASDAPLANGRLSDFLLPVAALVAGTAVSEGDALRGGIWGLLAIVIQQGFVRRRMSAHALAETACRGIGFMIPALTTILLGFMLQAVNSRLGLTEFVIEAAASRLPAVLLPAVAFAVVSAVTVSSGSFWGTYAIALPILVPLSLDAGMDPRLTAAAAISAGGFGSHACFFGDSTVLASQAAGCNNLAHARSQLPYAILGAVLTTLAYLAVGLLASSTMK